MPGSTLKRKGKKKARYGSSLQGGSKPLGCPCKGTDPVSVSAAMGLSMETTIPGSGLVQSRDGIVWLLMLDFTVRAGITTLQVREDSRLRVPKGKNTSGPCPCRDCDERSGNINSCLCVCACATGSHGRHPKVEREGGFK